MTLRKLHLRDLFWLVLVAAMALWWWVDLWNFDRLYDEVIQYG